MSPSDMTYAQTLDGLVQLADVVSTRVGAIKGEAAQRGQVSALDRAQELAEQLQVELCELQVTNACANVFGRVA